MRTGTSVVVDNDMGAQLLLTRWDDDHLEIELVPTEAVSNIPSFKVEFGIAGFVDELKELFS